MDKATWLADLKSYAALQREDLPIPFRETLSEEEEWHCRIIGGELISWHNQELSHIMRQRHVLSKLRDFDPNPLIVFTTSLAGLVAAQEIFPEPQGQFVYLLHEEFLQWQEQNPVDELSWLIHHWSYFRAVNKNSLGSKYKISNHLNQEQFRIHINGDLWGEHCGEESQHLWCWSESELELLKENFSHATS